MVEVLQSVQERLPALCEATLAIGEELGYSLRGWVVEEEGLRHYVVIKHNASDDAVLAEVLAGVRSRRMVDGMHVHANGNNLAFLPTGWPSVQPFRNGCAATVRSTASGRSGFGDSITDLGYMDLCHMWATPARSQLANWVTGTIHG